MADQRVSTRAASVAFEAMAAQVEELKKKLNAVEAERDGLKSEAALLRRQNELLVNNLTVAQSFAEKWQATLDREAAIAQRPIPG